MGSSPTTKRTFKHGPGPRSWEFHMFHQGSRLKQAGITSQGDDQNVTGPVHVRSGSPSWRHGFGGDGIFLKKTIGGQWLNTKGCSKLKTYPLVI